MRALLFLLLAGVVHAAPAFVDLGTVMKLAGATHEEVTMARARHAAAVADARQAWQRFWPSLSLGAGYRGHEGRVQDIAGAVFDARKQQYTVGAVLLADWAPGELYFGALAAKQRAVAAGHLADKVRRDLVARAVTAYCELLAAEAAAAIGRDELRAIEAYGRQLEGAVAAGTVHRVDLLRVQTRVARARLQLRQEDENVGLAAAALAEALRLPPETELRPAKADLVPVTLTEPEARLGDLVQEAARQRPELAAAAAELTAAGHERERARLAPLVPTVQAGYSMGGLGGGFADDWGNFSDSQDFYLGLSWRLGSGGLFDRQRRVGAAARAEAAALESSRLRAAVGREVVEAALKVRSARDQIAISEEAVAAAEKMVTFARERQASEIGVVLEYLMASEELARARRDRVRAVTAFNRMQHELVRAVGR